MCDVFLYFRAYKLLSLQDRGDGISTNLHNTMAEKLVIMAKNRPLIHPGEGYFTISPGETLLQRFEDMSFKEHLVPRLVKLKLKAALKEAIELQHFKGDFTINLK